MQGKRVKDSLVTLSQFMMPQHANPMGNVHGGEITKLADEAGGLCAMRHAQRIVVTVAIDSMTFHSPAHVGDLVLLNARITWVGRTSIEASVEVVAENVLTGQQTHTNSAHFVYVALDENGRPTEVPPLILETEEDHRRWAEGEARQRHRLEQQKRGR